MNTSLYSKTPSVVIFDNRSLYIRDIQYHRHPDLSTETDERITRYSFNVAGVPTQSLSPRQYDLQQANISVPPNRKTFNSLRGEILRTDSTDEGTNVVLSDVEGRSVISINATNVRVSRLYEEVSLPGRLLSVTEKSEGETARVVERFLWAGNSLEEKSKNLAGSYLVHYHCSGADFIDSIALTGNTLSERRRFLLDEQQADWQNMNNADSVLAKQVFTTSTTSDATSEVLTQIDTQGNQQRQRYNIAGQLKAKWLMLNGQTTEQIIIRERSYTAAGQIAQEIAGNGVVTNYRYEPETQRLIRIRIERPAGHISGSAILQDLRYAFDPVGNVIALRNDAEATRFWRNQKIEPEKTYIYDSLYQLIGATGREMANSVRHTNFSATALSNDQTIYTNYIRTYSYDRDNNLIRIQHSSPAIGNNYSIELTVSSHSNRAVLKTLAQSPSEVESLFDAAGNQLQLQPGQNLSWNSRGQLQQVMPVMRDSVSTSDREWYRYNADGQRAIKSTYQMQGNSQRQIRKMYLPALEIVTISQGGSQTEAYDRIITGSVEVLHWRMGKPSAITNDSLSFHHSDQAGSAALETDKDGLVISQEEFYPFGETALWLACTQIEADYKTYRYSGKERDATGLYYYGFRYYQSWVGRWLSADPAGVIDGLNQYRMVRNNPITLIDNDGLSPVLFTESYNNERGDLVFGLSSNIESAFNYTRLGFFTGNNKPAFASFLDHYRALVETGKLGKVRSNDIKNYPNRLKPERGVEVLSLSESDLPAGAQRNYHRQMLLDYFSSERYSFHRVIGETGVKPHHLEADTTKTDFIGALAGDVTNSVYEIAQIAANKRWSKSALETVVKGFDGFEGRVHFLLDGLDLPSIVYKSNPILLNEAKKTLESQGKDANKVLQLDSDTRRPDGGDSITASELRFLYRNRDKLGGKVLFFKQGYQVPAPWVSNPTLWNLYQPKSERRQ